MITPKETFRKSGYAKGWQDVVDSTQFEQAVNAALLEMEMQNTNPADMGTAASWKWRAEGAKQFLKIFMGLTETEVQRKAPVVANLNHRA